VDPALGECQCFTIRPFGLIDIGSIDARARRFHLFCERYWGKGDAGREEIYQTYELLVPYHDDILQDPTQSGTDHAQDSCGESSHTQDIEVADRPYDITATASSMKTTYKTLSIGSDFENFFGDLYDTILVRDEHVQLVQYLGRLQAEGAYQAVIAGRPGIGWQPFYLHSPD
jgi:hypothetical protein